MTAQLLAPASPRGVPWMPDSRCSPEEPHRQRGMWATGLTKRGAKALLDWLEAHGHGDYQVSYIADEGFSVTE